MGKKSELLFTTPTGEGLWYPWQLEHGSQFGTEEGKPDLSLTRRNTPSAQANIITRINSAIHKLRLLPKCSVNNSTEKQKLCKLAQSNPCTPVFS